MTNIRRNKKMSRLKNRKIRDIYQDQIKKYRIVKEVEQLRKQEKKIKKKTNIP